jgi:hypothetical protein
MAVCGSQRPTGPTPRPDHVLALIRADAHTYSGWITTIQQEHISMSNSMNRHRRRPAKLALRLSALSVAALATAALAATLLASSTAGAQSTRPAVGTPPGSVPAIAPSLPSGPDLQGLWDFTMRMGERTSPGFLALGPVERGWAGSITMYLTNTLAIRAFTVDGDSVRMVVASREGDVLFRARLTADGRTMEGIVDYHGGARVPMIATRRALPAVPR